MLKRSTWLALLVLAILIGWMIYIKQDKAAIKEEAKSFPTLETHIVFSDETSQPNRIVIKAATGETVEVGLGMGNLWELILPFGGVADQGLVEAAATQISSLRSIQEISQIPLNELGLEKPAYVITIGFVDGKKHTLEIGDQTPSASGYYVQVDKDKTIIIEGSGIDGLLGLLASPPYRETPTPSPTASPSPSTPTTATAQGTLVPADTATPTP